MSGTAVREVLIALGTNVGERLLHLRYAIDAIARLDRTIVLDVSRLYENPPWGGPPGQGDFLNAVLLCEVTGWDPDEFLQELLRIERDRLRVRTVKNGPRTLDLDILLFGQATIDGPGIVVPHPAMLDRPFVLWPAADVAGTLRHPKTGVTIAEAAASVGMDGLVVVGERGWHDASCRGVDRRNPASR